MTARYPLPAHEPLLLPCEASELTGLNPEALRYRHVTGSLPAIVTLGGRRRYREADVLALRSRLDAAASRKAAQT